MSITDSQALSSETDVSYSASVQPWWRWLLRWEVYLVVLLAGFLRFYQLQITEFDDDQAVLFRMAHDAVRYGLLPVTSNTSSVNTAHPPEVIYLFMIPALFSPSPLGVVMLIALAGIVAAVLTYFFTARYYGRVAGIVAALLYATAQVPVYYDRFIWQPNIMPPFVVLFIFALFRGAVDRRAGWLFPALFLIGVLYQMHETAALLIVPLALVIIVAPETVRRRDFVLAGISLLLIFLPFILWQLVSVFSDLSRFLVLEAGHASVDPRAWNFYRYYLSPYDHVPSGSTVAARFVWLTYWLVYFVPLLFLGGLITAILLLRVPRSWKQPSAAETDARKLTWNRRIWQTLKRRQSYFHEHPFLCGLLILLIWQIFPFFVLYLHEIGLTWHYFLIFMPGPFILIGFFVSKALAWLKQYRPALWNLRYVAYLLLTLAIAAQFLNVTTQLIDTSQGHFNDRGFKPYPYHNDYGSMQRALDKADQVAQQRHIHRIYITTDAATQTAMRYLAEQMQTPTTLFDAAHCLVLPDVAAGPAIFLVGPYDDLTTALLDQYTTHTLIDTIARLGGLPYHLYEVASQSMPSATIATLSNHVQLHTVEARTFNGAPTIVTRWTLLQAEQPQLRTTYNYNMILFPNGVQGKRLQNTCTFTSVWARDQLVAVFHFPAEIVPSSSVALSSEYFTTSPYNPYLGPLHLETDRKLISPYMTLTTDKRESTVTVSVSH